MDHVMQAGRIMLVLHHAPAKATMLQQRLASMKIMLSLRSQPLPANIAPGKEGQILDSKTKPDLCPAPAWAHGLILYALLSGLDGGWQPMSFCLIPVT